jgi:uncharacterized cupin superfamily protein
MSGALPLGRFPLHLGLGASAVPQPEFTGPDQTAGEWYAAYAERTAADGVEGRLVSCYTFDESWTSWEMHPAGAEAVFCVTGEIVLVQEIEGEERRTTLRAGDYAVNPPGVWHTADLTQSATVLFITAGLGTEHRPR